MKRLFIILFLFSFHLSAFTQTTNGIPSSISIAETSVADTRTVNIFKNPAANAFAKQTEFAYQFENRYIINELSTNSVQALVSTSYLNIDFAFSYFGYALYHEMLGGIGFSRNFSDRFSIGVRFVYLTAYFSQDDFYKGTVLAQTGIIYKIKPRFAIGFETFNPFQSLIRTEFSTKKITSLFSLGTEFQITDDFVWRTQLDKEIGSKYRFALGFEYLMLEKIKLKLGSFVNDYFVAAGGVGLHLKNFQADFNCEVHPILGVSPLLRIKYSLKK